MRPRTEADCDTIGGAWAGEEFGCCEEWGCTAYCGLPETEGLLCCGNPVVEECGELGGEAALRLREGNQVMDNLQSHKVTGVREAIEAVGAQVVYLPPYSPDLNPIEQVFSKLKWLLRSAGERTMEGLWSLLGRALDHFPPDECRRYLAHCGYNATRE